MTIPCKRVVAVLALVLLGLATLKAATQRYKEREDAFRKECEAQRAKLGLSASELRAKYPTPELKLVSVACVPPGGTAEVVIAGRFADGARFFVENDNFEVLKESAAKGQYRATIRSAPGIGPESAAVTMINAVTAQTLTAVDAVKVAGVHEWALAAANGWKVIARSQPGNRCAVERTTDRYDVSFFRSGEKTPFEKVTGNLVFLPANQRNYRFDLSAAAPPPAGLETYQALMEKMVDPKLTDAERDQLMARLEQAQQEMMATLTKMTDPAYVRQQEQEHQRREQEFGCRYLEITVEGGKVTGEMSCSEKVGRRLALTGTVAPVK